MAVLLYLRPGLRTAIVDFVVGTPAASSAATPAPPPPSAGADVQPPPASATSPPPAPRPTAVDGIDAAGWRSRLRDAAKASDPSSGAKALLALASLDRAALSEGAVVADAASIAVLVELRGSASAAPVFDLLGSAELGSAGPDVLYEMATRFGGSRGAARATAMLSRKDVRGRASPALRLVLALRDAPCHEKREQLERVGLQGDGRALTLLQQMQPPMCDTGGGCCLHIDPRYGGALLQLRQRVARQR
jgi:hypothetical protein